MNLKLWSLSPALLMVLSLGQTALGQPSTHPASQKYRDSSAKPATGRSGSASLETRALIGKSANGLTTDFEITTGKLDGSVAPKGTISKVQLKALDAQGHALSVMNANGLKNTGTVALSRPEFGAHQGYQIQANVGGIDPKRTDVVTVQGSVLLRPDLRIEDISLPSSARSHELVSIAAAVHETNGDLGATADCVLEIDGAEAARLPAIWVDKGGLVSCAFSYRFDAVGTHAVRVSAVNVAPADYDTANNAATASIDVRSGLEASLNAQILRRSRVRDSRSQQWYQDPSVQPTPDYDYVHHESEESLQTYGWASINKEARFPLSYTVRHSIDGVEVAALVMSDVGSTGNWVWGDPTSDSYEEEHCRNDYAPGIQASICTGHYHYPWYQYEYTSLWTGYLEGEVVYLDRSTYCPAGDCANGSTSEYSGAYPLWYWNSSTLTARAVTADTELRVDLGLTSPELSGSWAQTVKPTTRNQWTSSDYTSCYDAWWSGTGLPHICQTEHETYDDFTGWAGSVVPVD